MNKKKVQKEPKEEVGKINIESEKYRILNITVFNALGKKVYETTKCKFEIADQPNGVYVLQIKTEKGIATKKIIVQK